MWTGGLVKQSGKQSSERSGEQFSEQSSEQSGEQSGEQFSLYIPNGIGKRIDENLFSLPQNNPN